MAVAAAPAAAVAAPWIAAGASALGGYLSGRGSKKAAKNAKPDIPAIFKPAVGAATSLITSRLQTGFPRFGGPFVAGLSPEQTSLIGAGTGGINDALRTLQTVAESGLDPATVRQVTASLAPFFQRLTEQNLGQARETQAQGGRFFGTGGVGAEADVLERIASLRSQTELPLALQILDRQTSAAQALPGFLQSSLGALDLPRQIQQAEFSAQFQEFLRTQPENAIGLLGTLLTGTPFQQPPLATNVAQGVGAGLQGLGSSPGFLQLLQDLFNKQGTSIDGR